MNYILFDLPFVWNFFSRKIVSLFRAPKENRQRPRIPPSSPPTTPWTWTQSPPAPPPTWGCLRKWRNSTQLWRQGTTSTANLWPVGTTNSWTAGLSARSGGTSRRLSWTEHGWSLYTGSYSPIPQTHHLHQNNRIPQTHHLHPKVLLLQMLGSFFLK